MRPPYRIGLAAGGETQRIGNPDGGESYSAVEGGLVSYYIAAREKTSLTHQRVMLWVLNPVLLAGVSLLPEGLLSPPRDGEQRTGPTSRRGSPPTLPLDAPAQISQGSSKLASTSS
jgi:hypothetical protein